MPDSLLRSLIVLGSRNFAMSCNLAWVGLYDNRGDGMALEFHLLLEKLTYSKVES